MNKRDFLTKLALGGLLLKGRADVKSMHRNTKDARKKNEQLLFKILRTNQSCDYGQKHDFANIHTVEEYRKALPITEFSDYEDYVVRMIDNNEENLMTSLPLVGYAQSSGSVGKRKLVPITQPEVDVYCKYTFTRMLALADAWSREHTGKGMKLGRGMLIPPSFDDFLPNGLPCSNIADVVARQFGIYYPYGLNVPLKKRLNETQADSKYINLRFALEDKNTLFMFAIFFKEYTGLMRYLEKNWETFVSDIEKGEVSELSKATPETLELLAPYIKPMPERATELRAEFEKGFDETILKRLWPNLAVLAGIGTSTFTPFSKAMRKYAKGVPFDFTFYGASEGLFGAVDALDSNPQLLLVDSCFYEFEPVDQEGTYLCIDEVEVGKEYEIIITNQAGLYRYKCGDVVKIVGFENECPYIEFSYRKGQLLNMTGEKTTEEHMAAAVKAIGKEAGCTITNWAVYVQTTEEPYYYVLLLENNEGVDLSPYSDFAHKQLMDINARYGYFFMQGAFTSLQIVNQEPGTHAAWDAYKRENANIAEYQAKPVRVLDKPDKEEFFLARVIK